MEALLIGIAIAASVVGLVMLLRQVGGFLSKHIFGVVAVAMSLAAVAMVWSGVVVGRAIGGVIVGAGLLCAGAVLFPAKAERNSQRAAPQSKPEHDWAKLEAREGRTQILLHEYDSLRAEIMTRTTNMYQLFAMVIFVVGWIATASSGHISRVSWIILSILLGLAFYLYFLIDRDIRKAAERIREIEEQVDLDTGDWYLLRWERLWGGAKTSFLGGARHLDVPEDPRQDALSAEAAALESSQSVDPPGSDDDIQPALRS